MKAVDHRGWSRTHTKRSVGLPLRVLEHSVTKVVFPACELFAACSGTSGFSGCFGLGAFSVLHYL